jgi:peptide/nickel transport system substrate-binding protein
VAAGGHCLIATATYGSELSDEVQFLRNFRDKSILRTNTGSNFMVAFNAWYYSFSPYVAQFIREHSLARTATKLMLFPLMGILRLGAAVFYVLPANLEASAVVSGLLVSSLIGIVYLTPPLMVVLASFPRARRAAKRLQLPSVCILVGALAAVVFTTTVGAPSIFMMLATATIVLSALAASALYASRAFSRLTGRV